MPEPRLKYEYDTPEGYDQSQPYQTGNWKGQLLKDVQNQFVPQAGEPPEATLGKTMQLMLGMSAGRSPGAAGVAGSLGGARNVVKPEYYVAERKDGTYSVAKFEGSKAPTAEYKVNPGHETQACDCWDFTKRGGYCIHQKMVDAYRLSKELKGPGASPGEPPWPPDTFQRPE